MSKTLIWNTKVSTRNNCEFLVFRVIKQRRMIRCVTWTTRFRVYYRTIYRYRSISTPIMFTSSIGTINLGIEEEKGGKSSLLKGTTISQSCMEKGEKESSFIMTNPPPLKDFVVFGYSNPRNCFFCERHLCIKKRCFWSIGIDLTPLRRLNTDKHKFLNVAGRVLLLW